MLSQLMTNDYSFLSNQKLIDNLQYLDHFNNNYQFKTVTVLPSDAYKYQGNLFGLFKMMNIETSLYVFTMYLNGYNHPVDFDGSKYIFKLAIKPPIPFL